MVSDPKGPALMKASEKPRAGTTAVARVTRSLTETMKASPSFWTEPAKISRLFGPTRGKPQDATSDTTTKRATNFAQGFARGFTTRSPRPVTASGTTFLFCAAGLSGGIGAHPASVARQAREIQHFDMQGSGHQTQLLPWCRAARLQRVIGIFRRQHHVHHLPQQLTPPAGGIEAAGDLAGLQQVAAILLIGFAVRAAGTREKFGQRLVRDELGLGIDRLPEHLERDAAPEHLLRGGG